MQVKTWWSFPVIHPCSWVYVSLFQLDLLAVVLYWDLSPPCDGPSRRSGYVSGLFITGSLALHSSKGGSSKWTFLNAWGKRVRSGLSTSSAFLHNTLPGSTWPLSRPPSLSSAPQVQLIANLVNTLYSELEVWFYHRCSPRFRWKNTL